MGVDTMATTAPASQMVKRCSEQGRREKASRERKREEEEGRGLRALPCFLKGAVKITLLLLA